MVGRQTGQDVEDVDGDHEDHGEVAAADHLSLEKRVGHEIFESAPDPVIEPLPAIEPVVEQIQEPKPEPEPVSTESEDISFVDRVWGSLKSIMSYVESFDFISSKLAKAQDDLQIINEETVENVEDVVETDPQITKEAVSEESVLEEVEIVEVLNDINIEEVVVVEEPVVESNEALNEVLNIEDREDYVDQEQIIEKNNNKQRQSIVFSDFSIPESYEEKNIVNIQLRVSMAAFSSEQNDKIVFEVEAGDSLVNAIRRYVNDVPVAYNVSATTNEDNATTVELNCSDIEGDSLSYNIVTNATNGTLSLSGNLTTYTPDSNFNGADSFTYKCNDGNNDSNTATASLTVTSVADDPSISSTTPAYNPSVGDADV